jgi:sulfatase modifying factor 1
MAERLRQNTVRIESTRHGFGFIVGELNGQLYIVTARHILVGEDQPDSTPVTKAKVTFYSDQGRTYDADVLGTHEGDLAVLRLPAPAGFRWIKGTRPVNTSSTTEVSS